MLLLDGAIRSCTKLTYTICTDWTTDTTSRRISTSYTLHTPP